MQRNQIAIKIALALLVGVFILGGALFNIAIGEDDPNFEKTIYFDLLGNEVEEEDSVASLFLEAKGFGGTTDHGYSIDIAGESASVYISGERIVDEVSIGSVSVSGGVYAYTEDTFCYYAGAYSNINGENTGKANAWVQVAGNKRVTHGRGPNDDRSGDADVGGYYPSYVSAWDIKITENIGGKRVRAGAKLRFGGVAVRVKFEAEGV